MCVCLYIYIYIYMLPSRKQVFQGKVGDTYILADSFLTL